MNLDSRFKESMIRKFFGKRLSEVWQVGSQWKDHRSVLNDLNVLNAESFRNPLDKAVFTLKAATSALNDPYLRGDMVAAVGETLGEKALRRMHVRLINLRFFFIFSSLDYLIFFEF